MSRARHHTDPAVPAAKLRETDPPASGRAWAGDDDSLPPLESSRAPMGTHEVPPEHQTKVESPGARGRTPAPRSGKSSSPPPVPRRDSPETRVGAVLGSYRLVELIGKGGMGFVYRAEHTKLGREVALKLLRSDYARRRDSVARFFQEARTVNRIRHRNIIDVTDFVELDDGTTFIIMELLRGQSLGRWAREHFDLARALALLVQICDGLAAAHAVGVIHRDLKPDNVIVVPTGDGAELIKLLDFGVAKLVHREDEDLGLETAAGSVIGTPAYMSPEQAGGLVVDERADIYSLGAIMYELFTGTQMFRGRSFGEYVRKHLSEQPIPPRATARGATLPDAVEAVLLRCIEKEPARRYPTIEALREDLLGLLGGIETIDPAPRPGRLPSPLPLRAPNYSSVREPPALTGRASRAPWTEPPAAPPRRWLPIALIGGLGGAAIAIGIVAAQGSSGAATPAPAPARVAPAPIAAVPPAPPPPPPVPTAHPIADPDLAPPRPPAAPPRQPFDVRFDSTPSADVLVVGTSAPLCATPCTITIDPNDGGPLDLRTFTLHRDGYVDHAAEIDLAAPLVELEVTLTRAAGRSRPPRSRIHHGPTAPVTPPVPVALAPAPAPGPASDKPADPPNTVTDAPTGTPAGPGRPRTPRHGDPKVDPTATIDPFHQ
jgi:serine/threonine-protein kinase